MGPRMKDREQDEEQIAQAMELLVTGTRTYIVCEMLGWDHATLIVEAKRRGIRWVRGQHKGNIAIPGHWARIAPVVEPPSTVFTDLEIVFTGLEIEGSVAGPATTKQARYIFNGQGEPVRVELDV